MDCYNQVDLGSTYELYKSTNAIASDLATLTQFFAITDFSFHGSGSTVITIIIACNSLIHQQSNPPLPWHELPLSTTSVSCSTPTTPAIPSYNITVSTPQPH